MAPIHLCATLPNVESHRLAVIIQTDHVLTAWSGNRLLMSSRTCNLPLLEKQPVYPMTSKIVIKMLLLTHQWTDFRALPSEAPLCTHFFSRIAPNHGVYIRPNQEADMSQLKFTEPALKWLTADWVIFWFQNRPLIKRSFTRDINKWVEHNDFPVPCLI